MSPFSDGGKRQTMCLSQNPRAVALNCHEKLAAQPPASTGVWYARVSAHAAAFLVRLPGVWHITLFVDSLCRDYSEATMSCHVATKALRCATISQGCCGNELAYAARLV